MLEIQTEKFQGPLGLLLKLIEKEEIDITEIGLAKIADQYVEYIHNSPEIDADQMADFLVVAAKLLYIKSKALLPYLSFDDEEEDFDDLEKQLRMYKEFVDASQGIAKMIGKKRFAFVKDLSRSSRRSRFLSGLDSFSPPKNLKAKDLQERFSFMLARLDKGIEKLQEEKIEYKVSIEERIAHIQKMVLNKMQVNFSQLMAKAQSKTEIIVNFLAILELAKQRELDIVQEDLFNDIMINSLK